VRADVLVGSALFHGAALALFVHWLPPSTPATEPSVPPTVEVSVVPAPPPGAVLDVTIVELPDEPVPPAPPPALAATSSRVATTSSRIEPSSPSRVKATDLLHIEAANPLHVDATGTAGHEPSTGGHEPAGGGLLHMRGPDLALAPGTAEHIAAGGEPLHDRARESGRVENVPGGGGVIHDRVTTVAIERDGTAHFSDKPDIDVHFHSPIPHLDFKADMAALGDALQDWYRDPYAGTRYGPSTDLSEANHAIAGMCDAWGDPGCDDPLAPETEKRARSRQNVGSVGIHGSADLTAYLYRKLAHTDPYASRKLRLLDDTRAERIERGAAFRAEQAARSAELMQRTLEQLWASTPDPAARRTALFELWDDCADDEAGARAQAMVTGWIRAKLPAGSPDAYTTDELAALGARTTSQRAFEPYADSPRTSRDTPNAIAPPGTR